jgi:glycosyltransferase involved in cell wall biosynthesis
MTPEKGHAVLLAAWAESVKTMPNARLLLVGHGPERSRLEHTAAAITDAAVTFSGFREDVTDSLAATTIYVQPSLAEGLGTSVLDAMAHALPVVASRVGGLPEAVVHDETGLLVPPDDPSALAAAILELLHDPARARAMGQAGRQRVEELFSLDRMVVGHLGVYRSVVNR